MARPTIAVNYYFEKADMGNAVFNPARTDGKALFMQAFRAYMAEKGADVVTLDMADFNDPAVKAVVYFDYNWRLVKTDPFLRRVPFAKRALILIEPANINPSMYFVPFLRDRFATVFTWDQSLLARHPAYAAINVPLGAEPSAYRANPFTGVPFAGKKLLAAVSRNRWSYMFQSTYPFRKRAYRYFGQRFPQSFDLFGPGWDRARRPFPAWRGEIPGGFDDKVKVLSRYRFSLCFENNVSEPGYVSEKITDCFCARCVPVYYGSLGVDRMIPRECWIDMRAFGSFEALAAFLESMPEARHAGYIHAIDAFMASDRLSFFSTRHLFDVVHSRLLTEAKE